MTVRFWILVLVLAGLIASSILISGCGAPTTAQTAQAAACNGNTPPASCKDWATQSEQAAATIAAFFGCFNASQVPGGISPDKTFDFAQCIHQRFGTKTQVVPRAPDTFPCPAFNFQQPSAVEAVNFESDGKTADTGLLFRQTDGTFTGQWFKVQNSVGTYVVGVTNSQKVFALCNGVPDWTPVPHSSILASLPGIQSRNSLVTSLGGSAPYANVGSDGMLTVSLDTQTTLGNSKKE